MRRMMMAESQTKSHLSGFHQAFSKLLEIDVVIKRNEAASEEWKNKVKERGEFINKEFLEEVLRRNFADDAKVVSHKVASAVNAGDNYLSTMYRTTVEYTTGDTDRQLQLVIKGNVDSEFTQNLIDDLGLFIKEIEIYMQVLPEMYRHLKESFAPPWEYVTPEGYVCSRPNTLVMEDIVADGFKMAWRVDQLDLDHSMVMMRKFARLHALSVKLNTTRPEMIQRIVSQESYSEATTGSMGAWLVSFNAPLFDAIAKWGKDSRFLPAAREIMSFTWEKMTYLVRQRDGLNVINHGDSWINNIMFKYDENGKVISAKFVDFQLVRYCSVANDLHYFFFTSVKPDVLTNHLDDLTREYHRALTDDLATLGMDVKYPYDQLQDDMLQQATFGFFALFQILPYVLAPPTQIWDTETISTEHPMVAKYENWRYQAMAVQYLHLMESNGYLAAAIERMRPFTKALRAEQALKDIDEEVLAEEPARDKVDSPPLLEPPGFKNWLISRLSLPICQ